MAGTSPEIVAAIAAAGTAVGALIGSTSGGIVQFVLERKREARRAFAGARLVRLELSLTASAVRDAEHDGKWWVFWETDPLPSWEAYSEVLSVRLTPDQFEAVTQSVTELSRYSKHIQNVAPDGNGFWTLGPVAVANLKVMREHATAAFNALAKIARDPEVIAPGNLLHDDQEPIDPGS